MSKDSGMSLPDTTNWAVNEFDDAELGDLRRTDNCRLPDML